MCGALVPLHVPCFGIQLAPHILGIFSISGVGMIHKAHDHLLFGIGQLWFEEKILLSSLLGTSPPIITPIFL